MDYTVLKWVHVGSVILSGAGFALRVGLMLASSPRLAHPFARIAPHVVDTLLLASAIALAVVARLSPLSHPWLAAKIVGLFAYVAFGTIALKRGRTRRIRAQAAVAALATYAYIVGTALTRDPRWPLDAGLAVARLVPA